jgi:septal ring factor EnvC (AmiA/AmiB activator)
MLAVAFRDTPTDPRSPNSPFALISRRGDCEFSPPNDTLGVPTIACSRAGSTRDLENMTRERDDSVHKYQELLQDYQRLQNLLKKQESTMDTQRRDIIALREDVTGLRIKYDYARDQLQYNDGTSMAWESALEDKESTILDLRSQNDRLNSDLQPHQ